MSSHKHLLSALLALALGSTGVSSAFTQVAKKHIYPEIAAANSDVTHALQQAREQHKRVLLDFGGDWCPDCQVLDIDLHNATNLDLLERNFVLVHVNVGRQDANLDIARRYGLDVQKGVPALAVIDGRGKVLYSKPVSDFRDARSMDSQAVTDFLQHWKS